MRFKPCSSQGYNLHLKACRLEKTAIRVNSEGVLTTFCNKRLCNVKKSFADIFSKKHFQEQNIQKGLKRTKKGAENDNRRKAGCAAHGCKI